MNNKFIKENWQSVIIGLLVIMALSLTIWALYENKRANELDSKSSTDNSNQFDIKSQLEEHGVVPLNPDQASNSQATANELAYLIEEEKLAHDVYYYMHKKWDLKVFNNIKNSESNHQNMLLAVMESRQLSDPRTSEAGKFADQGLQKLYDDLIAQGSRSRLEAYKVGVIVEETDIADIKKMLLEIDAKDEDIKDVLTILLQGSENHLRAFNRQLDRL